VVTGFTTKRSDFESRKSQEFLLLHVVQTGFAVHPTSHIIGKGVKRPGCEADHSPPTSAMAKKMWICTSTSSYVFMVDCEHNIVSFVKTSAIIIILLIIIIEFFIYLHAELYIQWLITDSS
jgi:hypothetical protein